MDLGSQIRKKPIPDLGSQIHGSKTGLALKNPPKKTHPKKPKKTHPKKPTKNVFFLGFLSFFKFLIFYENNTNFSLSNCFLGTNK
jgi:hypothetical protein